MAENECVPEYDCREYFKEAVCIDAQRVYDSCSEIQCTIRGKRVEEKPQA